MEQALWDTKYIAALITFENEHVVDIKKALNNYALSIKGLSVTAKGKSPADAFLNGFKSLKKAVRSHLNQLQKDINSDAKNRHVNNGHKMKV